jgi:SAM-dependent methyltransferase
LCCLVSESGLDTTILDVGRSTGTMAIEMSPRGFTSYGVDFDRAALRLARELAAEERVNVECFEGDVAEWRPETLGSIDIALCFDIFEHLRDDELGALLQTIRQRLSPNGALVFYTFPLQYDYLFFSRDWLHWPLLPFARLPQSRFERVVRAYAAILDAGLLLVSGSSHKERTRSCRIAIPRRNCASPPFWSAPVTPSGSWRRATCMRSSARRAPLRQTAHRAPESLRCRLSPKSMTDRDQRGMFYVGLLAALFWGFGTNLLNQRWYVIHGLSIGDLVFGGWMVWACTRPDLARALVRASRTLVVPLSLMFAFAVWLLGSVVVNAFRFGAEWSDLFAILRLFYFSAIGVFVATPWRFGLRPLLMARSFWPWRLTAGRVKMPRSTGLPGSRTCPC